ncbi:MAG TPA: hypothetical protein DCY56_05065 [Candidatus Omnitrophica bacterium]|nr:hypothetical protein [Candidatus Omnitrophota bacterium]
MANQFSISVIVPAYNEEQNIAGAVSAIKAAAANRFSEYEILIIDDASSDNTGSIADKISRENPNVKVFHNSKNMGFGYNYKMGVGLATKDYIGLIPGDNEILEDSIKDIFSCAGKADMVLPYHTNSEERSLLRRSLSGGFTALLNLLFGYKLKYYNGPVVHKREIVTKVRMTTDGFAYQAEIITRLLKAGHSYIEVGMKIRIRQHGHSKALYPKNVWSVLKTIAKLCWELNLKR